MAAESAGGSAPPVPASAPMKVVFVGVGLTLLEALFDVALADAYAGAADGLVVTTRGRVAVAVVGGLFALAAGWYAYRHRQAPTKRTYLYVGAFAVVSLVTGLLFANVLTVFGAAVGYWRRRKAA